MATKTTKVSNHREFTFDLSHHGDEVIVQTDAEGHILLDIKIQLDRDEHRATKMRFTTQTQMERLFPALMKGLK